MSPIPENHSSSVSHEQVTEAYLKAIRLIDERVAPLLGKATTRVLIQGASKRLQDQYPFLGCLVNTPYTDVVPATIHEHLSGGSATQLTAGLAALLDECFTGLRELTGDLIAPPLHTDSIQDIVKVLTAAKGRAEKAAIITELMLGELPEPVAQMVRRCVILHWFDQPLIEAMLKEFHFTQDEIKDIYEQIIALPFVEKLPWGFALQDLTREGLLKRYASTRPDLLVFAARLAGPIYETYQNNKADAEALFCYIIAEDKIASRDLIHRLTRQARERGDEQYIHNLLEMVNEAWPIPSVEPFPLMEYASAPQQYQAMLAEYDNIITLDPNDSSAYHNRGSIYYSLGEYQRAIADYDRAIYLAPTYAFTYYNRGLVYYALKEYQRALADFNQATKLDPTYSKAYHYRGLAYRALKEDQQAITDFSHAIALDSTYTKAYHNRGLVYYALKKYSKALADYDDAIKLDSTYARTYYNRGLVYYALKEYQRAIADFSHTITLDSKYIKAYHNRGLVYYALKQYEQAIKDYDHAIELDPNYELTYSNRGLVYYALKQYQQAIEDYDHAIELDPTYTKAYHNRGLAYYALKEYQRALADFNYAILLDPTYARLYYNRGLVYYALKEYPQAFVDFDYAIVLDPAYDKAYYNRGLTQEALKGVQGSLRDTNTSYTSGDDLATELLRQYESNQLT